MACTILIGDLPGKTRRQGGVSFAQPQAETGLSRKTDQYDQKPSVAGLIDTPVFAANPDCDRARFKRYLQGSAGFS